MSNPYIAENQERRDKSAKHWHHSPPGQVLGHQHRGAEEGGGGAESPAYCQADIFRHSRENKNKLGLQLGQAQDKLDQTVLLTI